LSFAGAVSATNFTGAGHGLTNVPGAFFWVIVPNNTVAQPNIGYICTNDLVPVTITLPSSPVVRDVYKVAAVGAEDGIIAQNANQMIASEIFPAASASNWVARDSSRAWSAVASSADGTKLVATVKGGQIYTSINSGVTWTPQDNQPQLVVRCVVADGTKLVCDGCDNINLIGDIYTSINFRRGLVGERQRAIGNGFPWPSSADGTKQVEAVYGIAPLALALQVFT